MQCNSTRFFSGNVDQKAIEKKLILMQYMGQGDSFYNTHSFICLA